MFLNNFVCGCFSKLLHYGGILYSSVLFNRYFLELPLLSCLSWHYYSRLLWGHLYLGNQTTSATLHTYFDNFGASTFFIHSFPLSPFFCVFHSILECPSILSYLFQCLVASIAWPPKWVLDFDQDTTLQLDKSDPKLTLSCSSAAKDVFQHWI